MVCFDTAEAAALSNEEMEKLVVRGSGSDIKAKLEACGATGGEVCAAIIISVEAGKVKGSKWTLVGDMGMVDVSTHRLDGARGVIVTVDLTDMTKFTFPGVTDPRNGSNRSDWIESVTLANKMITENETVTDKHTLTNMDYFTDGRFSLRAVVVPIGMGETLIWVGAAPGTPAMIKEEAEKRGLTEYAPNIPTFGVKLVKKSKSNEAEGIMRPVEGDLVTKKWGMYPLIQVGTPEEVNDKLTVFACRN
jgi:hypothetical protein